MIMMLGLRISLWEALMIDYLYHLPQPKLIADFQPKHLPKIDNQF